MSTGEALDNTDAIIDTLISSLEITTRRVAVRGNRLTGGLDIKMFRGDFEDILALSQANTLTSKGEVLPWLEWLLIRGDEIIIQGYEIEFGSFPQSKSGEAVMVNKESGVWRVPPGVSGTIRNNWITRAVQTSFEFIDKVLTASVSRNIDRVF